MVDKSPIGSFWPTLAEPFRAFGARLADWLAPAAEASQNAAGYRIAIELPGVAQQDVQVTVAEGVVTVKGEKKVEREERGDTWVFSERQYGSFSRSFRLPADADPDQVSAVMQDGVLTVTVARRPDTASEGARQIPVTRA